MKRIDNHKTDSLSMIMPIEGRILDLKDSPDDTFSKGTAGAGFVIDPSANTLYAPFAGTIELIYPTRHVIVIRSASGIDVMIHIGFDQTRFRNDAIELLIKPGQTVKAGDPLASFDKELLDLSFSEKAVLIIFLQTKTIDLRSEEKPNYRITIRT